MMYHHVGSDRCSNDLEIFKQYLAYISKNFTSLFPTFEKLPSHPICLVFDDGYYDFYKYSFRIGNGVNKDFRGVNGVIYRIDGDFLKTLSKIFSFKNMLRFRFKTFIKNIVGNK